MSFCFFQIARGSFRTPRPAGVTQKIDGDALGFHGLDQRTPLGGILHGGLRKEEIYWLEEAGLKTKCLSAQRITGGIFGSLFIAACRPRLPEFGPLEIGVAAFGCVLSSYGRVAGKNRGGSVHFRIFLKSAVDAVAAHGEASEHQPGGVDRIVK